MSHNPFSDETESIEELQPKPRSAPVPQTPVSQQPVVQQPQQAATVVAQPVRVERVETQARGDALTIKFAIGKLNDYLQWLLMVIESILVIRFLLKMFGADPANLFANLIYTLTEILLVPFANIVPSPSLHPNQAFEISTLVAMLIYFLVFYALKRFLRILISSPEEPE